MINLSAVNLTTSVVGSGTECTHSLIEGKCEGPFADADV